MPEAGVANGAVAAAGLAGARPHAESTDDTGAGTDVDAAGDSMAAAGPPAGTGAPVGVEAAGVSRLVGAFGFGSELAELLPPATATIWQSMPMVLWIAWRRFSE